MTGHIRKHCRVLRCDECRRFGHLKGEFVRTYATSVDQVLLEDVVENQMDEEEAKRSAESATPQTKVQSIAVEESVATAATPVLDQEEGQATVLITQASSKGQAQATVVSKADNGEAEDDKVEVQGTATEETEVTEAANAIAPAVPAVAEKVGPCC